MMKLLPLKYDENNKLCYTVKKKLARGYSDLNSLSPSSAQKCSTPSRSDYKFYNLNFVFFTYS